MGIHTAWQEHSFPIEIPYSELHVWRFKLEQLEWTIKLLSAGEIYRAKRLLDARKQQQFVDTRNALRCLLGQYLQLAPELINFNYNNHGKPALAKVHNSTLSFNLSHSGNWAIFVVANGSEVGIDLEKTDPKLDFIQLANNYFSLSENGELNNLLPKQQRAGFYRLWTKKESILKLLGTGFDSCCNSTANRYNVTHFNVATGYAAAVASPLVNKSIHYYDFTH